MYSKLFQFELPEFLKSILQTEVITVYAYPVCILLGSLIAITYLRKKEDDIKHYFFSVNMVFIILLSAFIGGKLFLFFEKPHYYINTPAHIKEIISSGYVFYGSFIMCIISIILYLKMNKISILKSLDIIVLSTLILHAFGRFGCFLAGCCYGKTFTFGMIFPKSYPHKVHPTQLYEVSFLIIVFFILNRYYKTKRFHGEVFILYVMSYAIGRFIIEFFRGDNRGFLINNYVSHSQSIALILILTSSMMWIKLKNKTTRIL